MNSKVAIVHTGPVTIEPLRRTFASLAPDVSVVNIVDDSMLKDAMKAGHVTAKVAQRMCMYFAAGDQLGADLILNACSSVGEAADLAAQTVDIPVVKIDSAMARMAVRKGSRIGLVATTPTTIGPSRRLIEKAARESRIEVEVEPVYCDSAFQLLLEGDERGHDQEVISAIRDVAARTDVVVLAQVSMARLLQSIGIEIDVPVLVSLESGVRDAISVLESQQQ